MPGEGHVLTRSLIRRKSLQGTLSTIKPAPDIERISVERSLSILITTSVFYVLTILVTSHMGPGHVAA